MLFEKKKGFTLIELLVVIAIIALLMSVIMPALRKAKDQARLAICASNQHQLITALQGYTIENEGEFPPHPAERDDGSFSWVNYLNYHQMPSSDVTNAANEGTYYYLGSFLPQVKSFICPLGPSKPSKDLQEQYEDYTRVPEGTNVSYNLFWGGYELSDIDFVGPTGTRDTKKSAGLLVADSMNFWMLDQWWLAHRPGKGNFNDDQKVDPLFGNDCSLFWILEQPITELPYELKMNAGYVDGSVKRYSAEETIGSSGHFYIPKKWR